MLSNESLQAIVLLGSEKIQLEFVAQSQNLFFKVFQSAYMRYTRIKSKRCIRDKTIFTSKNLTEMVAYFEVCLPYRIELLFVAAEQCGHRGDLCCHSDKNTRDGISLTPYKTDKNTRYGISSTPYNSFCKQDKFPTAFHSRYSIIGGHKDVERSPSVSHSR